MASESDDAPRTRRGRHSAGHNTSTTRTHIVVGLGVRRIPRVLENEKTHICRLLAPLPSNRVARVCVREIGKSSSPATSSHSVARRPCPPQISRATAHRSPPPFPTPLLPRVTFRHPRVTKTLNSALFWSVAAPYFAALGFSMRQIYRENPFLACGLESFMSFEDPFLLHQHTGQRLLARLTELLITRRHHTDVPRRHPPNSTTSLSVWAAPPTLQCNTSDPPPPLVRTHKPPLLTREPRALSSASCPSSQPLARRLDEV